MQQAGKWVVAIGLIIVVIGALVWLLGDRLGWFGNLPGDVKVERENVRIYFPWVSMLLASVVISLLLWLFGKFFR